MGKRSLHFVRFVEIAVVLILVVTVVCGCDASKSETNPQNVLETELCNMYNGLLAVDGDTVFYVNPEQHVLYNYNQEKGSKVIASNVSNCFAVIDGYIYCSFSDSSEQLYRILPDGTGRELVLDKKCKELIDYNGKLYCAGMDGGLYSSNYDGTELTEIYEEPVENLFPYEENLYFLHGMDIMKLEPTTNVVSPLDPVFLDHITKFFIFNDSVYSLYSPYQIEKYSLETKHRTIITGENILPFEPTAMSVTDHYIIFEALDINGSKHKMFYIDMEQDDKVVDTQLDAVYPVYIIGHKLVTNRQGEWLEMKGDGLFEEAFPEAEKVEWELALI